MNLDIYISVLFETSRITVCAVYIADTHHIAMEVHCE